jgi:membrane protease YdiL (CAAX protease family)
LTVIILLTAYLLFCFTKLLSKKLTFKPGIKNPDVFMILSRRISGFLLFGVIPFIILLATSKEPLHEYGLNFKNFPATLRWLCLFMPVVVVFDFFMARSEKNLSSYPQIREKEWSYATLLKSTLTWILYLAGYEYMFRGFLLFSCSHYFCSSLSIAINTLIYSLAHINKGISEILGSIPLGIILCIITLNTGSIVFAFIIHVTLALGNEWFSIYANPEITIVKTL